MKIPFKPGPVGITLELAGLPWVFARMRRGIADVIEESPSGDGHTVLVIPGFTATDHTTIPLRGFLAALGYEAHGWNLGWNLGIKPEDEPVLEAHVESLAADGPITVIGWSLGGIFAREIARRRPELVRRVITLGTPIRGREGTAWIIPLFRLLNPAARDDLTPEGAVRHSMPIDVPITALYSDDDGVVDGGACRVREEDEGPDAENVRVDASHLGFGFNLEALRIIAEVLAKDSARLGTLK